MKQGEYKRHVDRILSNDHECDAEVNPMMHISSDHRPVTGRMEGEPQELLEFKHKEQRYTIWTPTKTSAPRIARFWAENIKGGENLEQIQGQLEQLFKQELEFAKHEQKRNGIRREETTPLTQKEIRLGINGPEGEHTAHRRGREGEDQPGSNALAARHS